MRPLVPYMQCTCNAFMHSLCKATIRERQALFLMESTKMSTTKPRRQSAQCLTVSIAEAGERLGYSRNTAYEAVKRGELPVIRLGAKMRVPLSAIDRLLAAAGAALCRRA